MYPGDQARLHPGRAAFVMAESRESLSYAELDQRSNQLAHLLRGQGLRRLDHYAVFMENNSRYLECCAAGERTGLYVTCANSALTAGELAYILENSRSRVLVTSAARLEVALAALRDAPGVALCLVVDAHAPQAAGKALVRGYEEAIAGFPSTPVRDESLGTAMLYSSGTTGRPKGVLRPLPEQLPSEPLALTKFLHALWRCEPGMRYLSPAPLYHAAPFANVSLVIRNGGTAVVMERFDPERFLHLVEEFRITHTQLVPTMFSRMLKLPEATRRRYDLSSLKFVVHAAAPCPVPVKEAMIDWWGPIIHEYYGATEGLGFAACDTEQWLAHRGTVGKVILGELHVLDGAMQPVPRGTPGQLWFRPPGPFEYFDDPERTARARSADGALATVGDVGYVDEDNFLYLTDRSAFVIISGGVNIYPQETENLLVTHPKVGDAAVFGIPDEDLGEQVKAVIELMPQVPPGPEVERELLDFCGAHLARHKCPRSIDFIERMPRSPAGKLYKNLLREPYWAGHRTRIL